MSVLFKNLKQNKYVVKSIIILDPDNGLDTEILPIINYDDNFNGAIYFDDFKTYNVYSLNTPPVNIQSANVSQISHLFGVNINQHNLDFIGAPYVDLDTKYPSFNVSINNLFSAGNINDQHVNFPTYIIPSTPTVIANSEIQFVDISSASRFENVFQFNGVKNNITVDIFDSFIVESLQFSFSGVVDPGEVSGIPAELLFGEDFNIIEINVVENIDDYDTFKQEFNTTSIEINKIDNAFNYDANKDEYNFDVLGVRHDEFEDIYNSNVIPFVFNIFGLELPPAEEEPDGSAWMTSPASASSITSNKPTTYIHGT